MKRWNIAAAKAHFSSMLDESQHEPQVICKRNQPVAAVISMDAYEQLTRKPGPTTGEMLAKLREIQEAEEVEIQIPPREDRVCPEMEG